MRAIAVIAAAALLFEAGGGQQFRTTISGLALNVFVTQRNMPVDGLTSADFVVLDNGVPQDIEVSTADRVPLDLTLILDVSQRTQTYVNDLKIAVSAIASELHAGDRLQLIVCGAEARSLSALVPVSQLPSNVLDPIDSLSQRGEAFGATATDVMLEVMAQSGVGHRQRIVLAIENYNGGASVISPQALESAAKMTDSVVYLANLPERLPYGADYFRPIAEAIKTTGGQLLLVATPYPTGDVYDTYSFVGPGPVPGWDRSFAPIVSYKDMVSALAGVVAAYHKSYVLTFSPKGVSPSGWHTLTVKVNKRGKFVVRTRTGYRGITGSRG